MLDKNGGIIYNDIIGTFNAAVADPANQHPGGGINWNFVDADLCLELGGVYSTSYLYEVFEVLVDNYYGKN